MGSLIVLGESLEQLLNDNFSLLKRNGCNSLIIFLAYFYFLVIIGTLMFAKGARELVNITKKIVFKEKLIPIIGFMDFHLE